MIDWKEAADMAGAGVLWAGGWAERGGGVDAAGGAYADGVY